jgi:putative flippase GtrA
MNFRILRFIIVGLLATAVHFVVVTFAIWIKPSVPASLATIIAFLVAFPVSFFLHSRFTFQADGSAFRFLITSVTGLCLNAGTTALIEAVTAQKFIAAYAGILIAPIFIYLLSSRWVFLQTDFPEIE